MKNELQIRKNASIAGGVFQLDGGGVGAGVGGGVGVRVGVGVGGWSCYE